MHWQAVSIPPTAGGTVICPGDAARGALWIQNLSAGDLYVDDRSGVTTATGGKVASGETMIMTVDPDKPVYGISSSGTLDVRWAAE